MFYFLCLCMQNLQTDNKGNKKITELQQSYKGKVKTHKYINRQNQSTTGKLKTDLSHFLFYSYLFQKVEALFVVLGLINK